MTLARLARAKVGEKPRILLTTVNAITQRVPQRRRIARETFSATPGNVVDTTQLAGWLETNGYQRPRPCATPANMRNAVA